jgi:DNA-binding transcriptional regulator YhcF (GntR family)
MDGGWNDNQRIRRQPHARIVALILDTVLKEGDPVPSVRSSAGQESGSGWA